MVSAYNKNRGGTMSRKKKINRKVKDKVAKLTDEQYGAYIMALKDERPPLVVRKTQQED